MSYPRIDDERRLLAALFLYPRAVDLDARHFLYPEHGVLFDCIQEAYKFFPWQPYADNGYDDVAVEIVVALVRDKGRESDRILGRFPENASQLGAWARRYIVETLMSQQVTAHALVDLIALVRACPRCGK